MIVPNYYEKFACIGGKCKNNCCKGGWEIEVDEGAMERFGRIGGEFGEKVMSSIDEDCVFIHKNGSCPLLTEDGWCEMALRGEELCIICDEYPRFTEYYGDCCERGISLSCEAAADIILGNQEKTEICGDSGVCDDELFCLLYNTRKQIFEMLQNRTMDVYKRIRLVIDYGKALQECINNNEYCEFSYTAKDTMTDEDDCTDILDFLGTLDALNDGWRDILRKGITNEQNGAVHIAEQVEVEQLAVYFVYRYFLKGAFDCDALSKLLFMAVSVMAIVSLAAVCGNIRESARLYSIEVEHNEENVEAVYDEFLFNEEFSVKKIINRIK